MELNDRIKKRGKLFKKFPISDWHQIVAFENIIKNYMKMIEILKNVGVHWTANLQHIERRLIKPLLAKSIGEKINNRCKGPGLLQQFESYILDTSIARLQNEFNLTSKVNHEYATHAKLADIVKELTDKLSAPEKLVSE